MAPLLLEPLQKGGSVYDLTTKIWSESDPVYHLPAIDTQIHTRTPVILPEEHHAKWLAEAEDGDLKELLKPFPADQMRIWAISPRVNSPENNDREIIDRIPGNIGDWKLAGP